MSPEDFDIASILNNLAQFYETQGNYEQAELLYPIDLKILETALGPDHPRTEHVRKNYETLQSK